MPEELITPREKALALNLDPTIYGTFAEIGAGQEVANAFFHAGASAGTVAKTISAYDMTMSDALYGGATRYVSVERLARMLDHEYEILIERLGPKRGRDTCFFSFADTVRARAYGDRQQECHGWMGLRFQLEPGAPPSDVILHVRLLDDTAVAQMEALGVLGVNLIWAAFKLRGQLDAFCASLLQSLGPGRVEIDLLRFSGHGFEQFDNRLCALQLVTSGLADAALFGPDGEVAQPSDLFYKRPVLLLRGRFQPVTKVNLDMLEQSRAPFGAWVTERGGDPGSALEVMEISMNNLYQDGKVDHRDFLQRADSLQALGKTVLVSRYARFHSLAKFIRRNTSGPLGVVLGIPLLRDLFVESWYQDLEGGILEAFGKLFGRQARLFVYPETHPGGGEKTSVDSLLVNDNLKHLYQYLRQNQFLVGIACGLPEDQVVRSSWEVRELIRRGDPHWQDLVPKEVVQSLMCPLVD